MKCNHSFWLQLSRQPFHRRHGYLLVEGELDGLHLLRPVLVIMEVVLDGERLEQLHGGLRPNLGHAVEEEDVLRRLARVVQLVGVKLLKRNHRLLRS